MKDKYDLYVESIKNKYNIDLTQYKNKEISKKIGELILFPEYAIKNILIGLILSFICFIISLVFLDFSLVSGFFYVIFGSSLFGALGLFLGLNIFILNLKSDLNNLLNFVFDLTIRILDDLNKVGKKLNKKEILEIFNGLIVIVLLPSLSDAISTRIPFFGSLINNLIQKIFKRLVKRVEKSSVEIDEKQTTLSLEFNNNIFIEIIKKNSMNIVSKTIKIIQFPFQIIFTFLIITMFLTLFILI